MAGDHPRNTLPMRNSPRCGARTRSGKPCQAPALTGKARCRMHGGAAGSGAPKGNRNALKDGLHTRDARQERKAVNDIIRQARRLARSVD
jgi:uncharacterized membrane protein